MLGSLSARLVCRGVGGAPDGPVSPLPGGLLAGGHVWTRRVVFVVMELGRLCSPGLGPFAGVGCQEVAWVGCLLAPLQAGDARCSLTAVAAWRCVCIRPPALLDARSCRGLRGVPAPDGAETPVVCMASLACGRCGELMVASGVEVDGLEDVEDVGLCGVSTPDGARAHTFVALVAAVARDRGGRVVMVAVLQVEEEELWCRPSSWPPPHCRTCPAAAVGRAAVGY